MKPLVQILEELPAQRYRVNYLRGEELRLRFPMIGLVESGIIAEALWFEANPASSRLVYLDIKFPGEVFGLPYVREDDAYSGVFYSALEKTCVKQACVPGLERAWEQGYGNVAGVDVDSLHQVLVEHSEQVRDWYSKRLITLLNKRAIPRLAASLKLLASKQEGEGEVIVPVRRDTLASLSMLSRENVSGFLTDALRLKKGHKNTYYPNRTRKEYEPLIRLIISRGNTCIKIKKS
jgi:hypothetical protein